MYKLMLTAGLAGLFLLAGSARAEGEKEARALVDKAVKAHGGAEKLARYKGVTLKMKGKFFGMGAAIDYTGDFAMQPPGQARQSIGVDVNGMKFTVLRVLDGDKGWLQNPGEAVKEMSKEELTEEQAEMHSAYVSQLFPLLDKSYTLAPLGEHKVGNKAAVGVKVSTKGRRDINLYFDKDKGVLLKSEMTVKDLEGGGKEVLEESLFEDYKEVEGTLQAMKVVINRGGQRYVDGEVTEIQLHEKLDASTFAKP